MAQSKAVVILSGGLDSTTCMGIAQAQGYELYPITFDYGQRHRYELQQAERIATYYNAEERYKVISLPFFREFGANALTDWNMEIPRTTTNGEIAQEEIPITYVPGRNLMFLSIAASYAEAIGAQAIYIGVHAVDYSGYPDCRPAFIQKVQETIAIGTEAGDKGEAIRIEAPLVDWTKAQIIQEGLRLNVPYHLTTSCYEGNDDGTACGVCDSCQLRLKGFAEVGVSDPIPYYRT